MYELRGFKFVRALRLLLQKIESEGETNYDTFYSHSKAQTTINKSDIDDKVFKSVYNTVIWNSEKSLGKNSGWIIDSVIQHNINISKCNPLDGSSYIKLPKEVDNSTKDWSIFKILMIMNALNGL